MEVEFDPAKDEANWHKHGVSLLRAADLDGSSMIVRPDTRRDYGEAREVGYGLIGERLYCVVFVRVAADRHRIISLRKANRREVGLYAKAQSEGPHAD